MATVALDIETYKDYFLAMFKSAENGKTWAFEMFPGKKLDATAIKGVLKRNRIITFNGNSFDLPLLNAALTGADCAQIKRYCDQIIVEGLAHWHLGLEAPAGVDHIDLIEVAPGKAGLKMYGGRMHCPTMQDLPISPSASIDPLQRSLLKTYCENDLDLTIMLFNRLKDQIALREQMTKEYGEDLRSKSDAQIAEAVIKNKIREMTGKTIGKARIPPGTKFKYKAPPFIMFRTPKLNDVLTQIVGMEFVLDKNGRPQCPPLEDFAIKIGTSTYRMGIGGLHSSESKAVHYADENTHLIDRDVASYYPSIILNCGLYPKHIGEKFLDVYGDIVARRLAAKKAKDAVTADSLKITINGSFGKFGSQFSVLYSPDLLIQTTVTGQLALLMLIESLEIEGVPVVSANTDGIVMKCPAEKLTVADDVVAVWEFITSFATEATHYTALYSRDVNNYVAVKPDGKVKTKGAYATTGLMKSPAAEICIDAVVAFMVNDTPVEKTIYSCSDIRKFVSIRQVKGGGEYQGTPLGKVARWYYAHGSTSAIRSISNGNKVATTDGCIPLMTLPSAIPDDLDRHRYVAIAKNMLADIGL